MAEFREIVLNLGPEKTCDLCGKPIRATQNQRDAAHDGNGITLTAPHPFHMHGECLRELLVWAKDARETLANSIQQIQELRKLLTGPQTLGLEAMGAIGTQVRKDDTNAPMARKETGGTTNVG